MSTSTQEGEKGTMRNGKSNPGIAPSRYSVEEAQIHETADDGGLHRDFTPRQIHVSATSSTVSSNNSIDALQIISLGSNVGSGLFIATGKALVDGGPGTMFFAYLMVCTGVWANLQSLGEMTVAFPTSGSYIDYAGRWVDPALAFGAGFAEWLGTTAGD